MADAFRMNTPHVVAETLDGEATIVNLDTGTYYALNESGSAIWDGLVSGAPIADVAAGLAQAYGIDTGQASAAVARMVEELSRHDLITSGGAPSSGNGAAPSPPASSNGSASAYVEPQLSSYTDMQELLLLDPIHEVDESGWPNRPF